ncbi:alpha/beta hydrolase domain-containing protein [Pseudofrankia saprophytica]|uniref:alpha/beta hydrolase domain-containing protein n=1 Tax=Pseudofrankia saprophytica TaxID=298655 RepID=UPI0031588799
MQPAPVVEPAVDLTGTGYVEAEYAVSGTATSYATRGGRARTRRRSATATCESGSRRSTPE